MKEQDYLLVVDQDQSEIDNLMSSFENDYSIKLVRNKQQLQNQLNSDYSPSLILLSSTSEDLDAFKLCKTLKSSPDLESIPVIIIAADANASTVEKAIKAGAADVISRPHTPELLKLRVESHLHFSQQIKVLQHIKHEAKESQHIHKQLLTAISSILIGIDKDDKITLWNDSAERCFSVRSEDAHNKTLKQLNFSWNNEEFVTAIQDCRSNNQTIRTDEITYTRADGHPGFLGFSITPIHEPGNHETAKNESGILIVGADITAKIDMEKQLLHAQKMESIGQLAAGIAHEINTPIQFVGDNINFLNDSFEETGELLKEIKGHLKKFESNESCSPLIKSIEESMESADIDYVLEEVPDAIEQSKEGITRVSKIVMAMKDFSHGSDEKAPSDLNRAIESTITVAQSEWKQVAKMVTELDPDLPAVPCLLSEFNQVILNMIINSSHAIADTQTKECNTLGTITLATKSIGDDVEVRLSDTGAGIPEDIITRVFDPFFTTKEVGKGTGQGLSIAHSVITQKHGGTINIESEPGEGTTFIITLPLKAA